MKKFKRRLDTSAKLVKIEGLEQIPLNLDGTVVYGIYVINYVWNYDGIRVVKPRILEFRPPDNRIEFRKNGVKVNKVEKINIISSQSTSPYTATFFSTINTSLPSDITAYYVERDIDDNITLEVEITNDVVVNTTPVQNSVVNNKLPEGKYVFYYEVEYDNGVTTYNKSIGREIVSTTYTTVPQQDPPPYTLVWESLPLPTINKDIGDAFPSIAEMTDIIPTAVLTETATGNTTRFATTYLTPTEPVGGVTTSSAHLIKFMAVNLLSGSGLDTGLDDTTFNTYVVPQLKTRTIQYNIPTQNPAPLPIEITFSPATLDNVVFQDFQSGSSPVPLSFENAGLFPSEAQLLSGVTATYVDDNSVVQPLAVSIVRPTGSLYSEPLKSFFFDNGEVKMHIPRTWPVKYSATAPDGNTKTITRNVVIQDTIAPVISQTIPATMEKGTTYDTWLNRQFYGYDYPRYSDAYPAPRSGTSIIVDKTESEFNALDDGDTFTSTYTSIDSNGNARIVVQVTTCEDTVSPTLAFNSTLTFSTGSNPIDEELKVGVTTSDLSEPITLTVDDSGVNYSVQGFYTASYTATDAYGNSRVRTRNIFVKGEGPTLTPPGPEPTACPTTPGVPNIYLDGTEVIANIPDSYWIDGLFAQQDGENISYKIVVSQDSIDALPTTAGGTLDYDDNGDGWIDVEVTPLYINYEIQDENSVPLVCTTRYIETIDTLAPTIYNIPNPILVYKAPNDPITGQSTTTPNDIIADIVSQINVVDNVDGTGFVTATLEGIGQVDINAGNDLTRTLRFTDSEGNESRYVTTIQFTDNRHPVITLLGDNPLTLTSSVLPSDPGATANDFEDGDITADIESYWVSTLGTEARQGTYNVKYTVEDSAGVIVEATRQVVVPYFSPSITLLGDNPFTFSQNPGDQIDPLAEAYSVVDGDLTSQIESDWNDYINGSTPEGTYTITYSITDSTGVTSTVTRTVEYAVFPEATASHLEESFEDSFGVQTPTSEQQNGQLIGGFYVDSLRNNGWVQGDFSDDLRPVNTADRFTFSAYYRILSTENDSIILFSARNGNNGWRMVIVKVNDTIARIYVSLNGTNVYLDTGNTVSFTTGQFHHVAMTYNNGTAKLYHNGTEVYSNASKPFVPNTPNDNLYTIGQGAAKVAIDEVSVYKDTELNPDQIGVLAAAVSDKDDEYDQAIEDYLATLPVVNSFNLEESYLDSNDDEQPVTQSGTSLSLVDGVFVDQYVGDYVYGGFSDDLRATEYLGKFSFSCYYKFTDSTKNGTLFLFKAINDNNTNGWRMSIEKNSNTTARLFLTYNGTGFYVGSTSYNITISLNQFYHVAMTSFDGTIKLYHNGSEVYSSSGKTFLPGTPNDNLYKIGQGSTKGEIDQVKVYKGTLLTPTEIANMATYSTDYTPPPSDPNAITDITTFGDTSISNDIITFDGDGDYAIYTGGFQYTTQHSVSFWFRTTATNLSYPLASHIAAYSPVYNGFFFKLNNGTLSVRALDVGSGENGAGSGYNDGQWHHVVMTYQQSTTGGRKVYVDNTSVVSINSGTSYTFATEFGLFIGALGRTNGAPYNNYTGDFYGLQVTNTVLTPTEIAAIYNAGVPT